MRAAYIFGLSTVISAFFTVIIPAAYTQRPERNSLERRTKFIIYDNKYEVINAHKNSKALTLQMMPIII